MAVDTVVLELYTASLIFHYLTHTIHASIQCWFSNAPVLSSSSTKTSAVSSHSQSQFQSTREPEITTGNRINPRSSNVPGDRRQSSGNQNQY